ncbi:MAG: class II fructose-bisphosphate aldolase [Chthoniobacteraceae bacterium]
MRSPEDAEHYCQQTGADFIVANLGTEHRAGAADLHYHGELARQIFARIGPKIVLHGCSSVSAEQIRDLYTNGVCKVNIWTTLERDSSPLLLEQMTSHAAKVTGARNAQSLHDREFLGAQCDLTSAPTLSHYTTAYRQTIVF